jgi:hypothetical protein
MHTGKQTVRPINGHFNIPLKQWLYAFCFLCLTLIDWSRCSQSGWIWAFSVNLTGPLLCILILSHFSFRKLHLLPYVIWTLIWAVISLLVVFVCRYAFPYGYIYQYLTGTLNVFCLGVMGIRMWQAKIKLPDMKTFQKILIVLWILLVLCMTVSPDQERVWPIWFFSFFTFFYAVPYTEAEKKQLWKGMSAGIILGFFALQIYAYGFRPYDLPRYRGAFGNSNMTALFYLVVLSMFLYLLWDIELEQRRLRDIGEKLKRNQVVWKYFYLLMAGGQVSFVFFTIGRTAMALSLVLVTAYGVLSGCYAYRSPHFLKVLRQWAILFGFVILTFPCVYLTIRYLPTVLHHPIWYEGEYTVDKVHSFDPSYSDKYVTFEEYYEATLGRFDRGMFRNLFSNTEEERSNAEDEMMEGAAYKTLHAYETVNLVWIEKMDGDSGSDQAEADKVTDPEHTALSYVSANGADESANDTDASDAVNAVLSEEYASDSSAIRREIFTLYWNGLNMIGHKLADGYFQITPYFHAWHAQNLFLQIGFYYGIPAGILSILLVIALGIRALLCFFRNPLRPEGLLPGLIWVVFVGYGTLECVWYPGQLILFLFFFVQKVEVPPAKQKITRSLT